MQTATDVCILHAALAAVLCIPLTQQASRTVCTPAPKKAKPGLMTVPLLRTTWHCCISPARLLRTEI